MKIEKFSDQPIITNVSRRNLLKGIVGTGGLLSLPLGWMLARWLDAILKTMPGIPVQLHFFVFEPAALATHAALLTATALLAAAYPMWIVARLPITATLRDEVAS